MSDSDPTQASVCDDAVLDRSVRDEKDFGSEARDEILTRLPVRSCFFLDSLCPREVRASSSKKNSKQTRAHFFFPSYSFLFPSFHSQN